jgi:hypothetical protein
VRIDVIVGSTLRATLSWLCQISIGSCSTQPDAEMLGNSCAALPQICP